MGCPAQRVEWKLPSWSVSGLLLELDFISKAQRREDSKGPSSLGAFETLSLDSSFKIMLEPSQVQRPGLPELSTLVSPPAEAGGLPGSELPSRGTLPACGASISSMAVREARVTPCQREEKEPRTMGRAGPSRLAAIWEKNSLACLNVFIARAGWVPGSNAHALGRILGK